MLRSCAFPLQDPAIGHRMTIQHMIAQMVIQMVSGHDTVQRDQVSFNVGNKSMAVQCGRARDLMVAMMATIGNNEKNVTSLRPSRKQLYHLHVKQPLMPLSVIHLSK